MVERRRLASTAPAPTPTSRPAPQAGRFRLNRNLMNYPIARDARVATHWRKSKQTGRWVAALPGEDRITLILPADTPKNERRHQTGLDTAVLFALLAEVQRTTAPSVTISYAALLRRLGLSVQNQNRKALRAALTHLSRLTLQIDCWHVPGRLAPTRKMLPPPVTATEREGHGLIVTVHDTWVRLSLEKSYYETIPLPLPTEASDQNAALLILTSASSASVPETSYSIYHDRGQSSFARKIGLSTIRRKARLEQCVARVSTWFALRGGDLLAAFGPRGNLKRGKIRFVGQKPKTPRITGRELECIVEGSSNVSFAPPKRSWNVSTTTKRNESRNDSARAVGSLRDRKQKKASRGGDPIRSPSRGAANSERKQARLQEIADAQHDQNWNSWEQDERSYDPYSHADPMADR